MNNTLFLIIFGMFTAYFGGKALQIMPTLFKLLVALATDVAKWPGPRIRDLDHNSSVVREQLEVRHQNLFPTFISNTLGVLGAFGFSLLTFIGSTPLMSNYVRINWTLLTVILTLLAFVGVRISFKKAQRNVIQVNSILSDLTKKLEPRSVDGQSAEAEYAIEPPLIGYRNLPSEGKRALDLFYESARYRQAGNEKKGLILYQEAMRIDPSLHKNARKSLLKMSQDCSSNDEGAIYYWLGIHSEYLMDREQAAIYYEKAINAFNRIGYQKRESRAHCNLGSVKMSLGDASGVEEFEKAVVLSPKNGTAYINIGITFYRISERGDPRFEKALDAFANAIIVDPAIYKPLVLSSLRSIGYTWKEDWEDIARRVVSKQPDVTVENGDSSKKLDELKGKKRISLETAMSVKRSKKTYRNAKHSFEIDIPEEWQPFPIPIPQEGTKALFQYGCADESFNFEIGSLSPEPTLSQTERDFVQFAMFRGFSALKFCRITVRGKEHVCASYHILDAMGERWNKKYMIVLSGTEYAITATCNDKKWFVQREKAWDDIVQSFRLLGDSM